jgi:Cof subfamily protein (haloacid dehalogenase superfamily)
MGKGLKASIVFADMDGTFLAADKSVPSLNLRLLDLLADCGIPFVPCTGRPVHAVPDEVLVHPATRYVVGANGAVVYDVVSRKRIHVASMSKRCVLDLYDRARDLEITFDIFADGEVYAERQRYEAMADYGIDVPTLEMLKRVRRPVDLTVPEIVAQAHDIEKVTCFWKSIQDRDDLEKAIGASSGFSVAHGHAKNFELQTEGVHKGFALEWLCEWLGVPVGESVAFGDEANDIPMLRAAGVGVAMQNATAEVRAAADCVTSSNDGSGVACYFGF